MHDYNKTVNVHQAAAASGVSRRCLYYWMAEGRLPYARTDLGRRVTLADVFKAKRTRVVKEEARH